MIALGGVLVWMHTATQFSPFIPVQELSDNVYYVSFAVNSPNATYVPFILDFGLYNSSQHLLPQPITSNATTLVQKSTTLYTPFIQYTSLFNRYSDAAEWGLLSLYTAPTSFCYDTNNKSIALNMTCPHTLTWMLHYNSSQIIRSDTFYVTLMALLTTATFIDVAYLPATDQYNVSYYTGPIVLDVVTPWFMHIVYVTFFILWVDWNKDVIAFIIEETKTNSKLPSIWKRAPAVIEHVIVVVDILLIAMSSSVMSLNTGHPLLLGDTMLTVYGFDTTKAILTAWCLAIQPSIILLLLSHLLYAMLYTDYGAFIQRQPTVPWIYIPTALSASFYGGLLAWGMLGLFGLIGTIVLTHFILNTESYVIVYGSILCFLTIFILATHRKLLFLIGHYQRQLQSYDAVIMLTVNWGCNLIVIMALQATFNITSDENTISTKFRDYIGTMFGTILMFMSGRNYILSLNLCLQKHASLILLVGLHLLYLTGGFFVVSFMTAPYFATLSSLYTAHSILWVSVAHAFSFFVFGALWVTVQLLFTA